MSAEKKIAELKDKISRMLRLTDYSKHPFTYLTLEMDLTREQIDGIFTLMDEISKTLFSGGKAMSHAEFERRVCDIVPQRKGDYHSAADIVATLNQSNQYEDVYRHMKKSGMNIR